MKAHYYRYGWLNFVKNLTSKTSEVAKSTLTSWFLVIQLIVLISVSTQAQLTSFDITASNTNTGADLTLGWEFQANDDITVSALGFFDLDADGLLASHQVGLWTSTGTLLGSVTVTPASSANGGFYYENLAAPINLTNGNSYRIAAHVLGDGFVYGADNIITDPDITIGSTYRDGPGFVFPTLDDGRQYLTSNFKVQAPAAIKSFDITFTNPNTTADMTLGWEFQTNNNITVTSLGFFDVDADGLLASHQVGLWTSTGTLLGSVTVTPASTPSGGFYYEMLTTPINLTSGNTYRIGAYVMGDAFVYGADNIVTDPSITKAATYRDGPGFVFPTLDDGREYITCNFLLQIASLPEITATKDDAILADLNGNLLVEPGDKVRYSIVISNSGSGNAINSSFADTPDANSALVVGSVTSTQGVVTSGNNPGNTNVNIDLGTIPAGNSVTITFDARVNFPLAASITQISNQGQVTGDNFSAVLTDDPTTGAPADPTVTPINHILGPKKISYVLTLPDCDNPPNTLIFDTGHFLEGESFTFPPFTLPAQYSAYQPYYNAFVGGEFGVPVGSLNEDITFVINLNDICLNGLIDNPDTKEIIELLFLNVDVIGSISGSHNPLEYYYFNDGKEAYIKLVLANIAPLSEILGFDTDQLIPFFTINSLNPDFTGIRKVVDATYYTIYLRHFSEVRVGAVTSPTNVDGRIPGLPTEYGLNQNFPNPFNPSTVITYAIPTASNVKIEIFDLTGEKITTLVDGFKSEGNYQVSFDASSLPSGMYLYRINAGAFVSTKKMVLVK